MTQPKLASNWESLRRISVAFIATVALPYALYIFAPTVVAQVAGITINFNDVHQRIDGFGAADLWAPTITDAQADLFFSPTNGIGLSILRVGIDPNGNDFSAYSNATKAAARGAIVWAGPLSAPGAWKDNGSTTNGGHLLPADYDAWATRLAGFAGTLQQQAGVPLYGLSVQNEPDFTATYDSMLYTDQEMDNFVKVLGPKLAALNPRPKLMMPEVSNWGNAWGYSGAVLGDSTAAPYLDLVAAHQYGGVSAPQTAARPIWETEMSSFEAFDPSIGNGLTVARWIHDAITIGNVNAWHYWWLLGRNADDEGLIGYNGNTQITKRLYTVGNFSKFVRPGFVVVGTSGVPGGVSVTAYKNPSTGAMVIVAINQNGSDTPMNVTLSGLTVSSVTPWVTSGTLNLAQQAALAVSGGTFTATLPAASVTSFVGSAQSQSQVGTPTSPSPANGSSGVNIRPTLTWSASGATSYDVQFGTSNPPAVVAVNQTTASYAPAALNAGTVYYWQIVARNGSSTTTGPVWSFTTASTGTTRTYVSDTFSGGNGTALAAHAPDVGGAWVDDQAGLQLRGNAVTSAQLFGDSRSHNTTAPASADYEVSMDIVWSGATSNAMLGVIGRGDGAGFRGDGYVAYYDAGNNYWALMKLVGYNPISLGTYAQPYAQGQVHTLKLSMVGTAITVFVDGASRISVTDSSITAVNNAGIYARYGSENTSIVGDNYLVADPGGVAAPPPPPPPPPPPSTPTSPNPADGSSGVGTVPTLTWSASNATSYDVMIGATTPPALVATGVTSASYSPRPLTAGTTYYWQIVAHNSAGTTTGSIWTFATAPASQPPQAPASPSPANVSSGVSTGPTLTWSASGATSYDVQFGTSNPPAVVAVNQTGASYAPAVLTGGTVYYWQIVARNSSGTTTGPVWSFTTGTTRTYVSDTFSGGNGTALAAHAPDVGGAWVDDQAGLQLRGNAVTSAQLFGDSRSHNTTAPASADYEVSMDIVWSGATSNAMLGVIGRGDGAGFRGDGYVAYYDAGNNYWALMKLVGYNPISLGTYAQPYAQGQVHTLKLSMVGTAITVFVDGASRISVTDSSITAVNNAGIYAHYGSENTSIVGDNYLVADAGGTAGTASTGATASTSVQQSAPSQGLQPSLTPSSVVGSGNVVIRASDLGPSALHGAWSTASDATSPDGVKLIASNAGRSSVLAPLASPPDYIDATFEAPAGTPYTIWVRMRALDNDKSRDSLWVQFSDAFVDGIPVYALGSDRALLASLATDATGLSLNQWGWQNGAYWLDQPVTVTFATSGLHTLRIQVRDYGVEFDQIVLSSTTYLASAPGSVSNDRTIVPK